MNKDKTGWKTHLLVLISNFFYLTIVLKTAAGPLEVIQGPYGLRNTSVLKKLEGPLEIIQGSQELGKLV